MALTVTEILAPVGQGATPATVLTATFTGSANVGDYVFVTVIQGSTGALATPTDSAGNVYSLDNQDASTTATMRHGIAACRVTKPIIAGVTTLSLSVAAVEKALAAFVVQSPGLVLELDKTNHLSSQATATTMTTGASGALVTPYEFCIATYGWGNTDSTFTETGGWTNPHGAGVRLVTTSVIFEAATQYQTAAATTSLNPAATLGTSNPWAGDILTYRILNAYSPGPFRIPNPKVGPMALRQRFRRAVWTPDVAAAVTTPVSAAISAVIEALGGIAAAISSPAESTQDMQASSSEPIESIDGTPAQVAAAPVEATQGVTPQTVQGPVEAFGGVSAPDALPLEAAGAVSAPDALPLEAVQPLSTSAQEPVEALAGGVAASSAGPVESPGGVAASPAAPVEAAGGVSSAASTPVESLASLLTLAGFPVESALAVATSAAAALEALGGIAKAGSLPIDVAGAAAALAALPVEEIQGGLAPLALLPIESLQSTTPVSQSVTVPLEALLGLAAPGLLPIEAGGTAAPPAPPVPTDGAGGGGGGFPHTADWVARMLRQAGVDEEEARRVADQADEEAVAAIIALFYLGEL